MNLLLRIMNKKKIKEYEKSKAKRNLLFIKELYMINTEEELLDFYNFIEEMVVKIYYYKKEKISRVLFFDDMIFISSYLIASGKEELLEKDTIQEKIDDIMYYLFMEDVECYAETN